jgi:hypothetical protein
VEKSAAAIRPGHRQAFVLLVNRQIEIFLCYGGIHWLGLINRHGVVYRRRVKFKALEVRRTLNFVVHDTGWLHATIAGMEGHFTFAFVEHRDPSFQYIKQLKIAQMPMHARCADIQIAVMTRFDAADRGMKFAPGGFADAEIAVFKVTTQAAVKFRFVSETGAKGLFGTGHGLDPESEKNGIVTRTLYNNYGRDIYLFISTTV